ncbi:unnamed protein product, partial [marine sediment metagenome]
REIPPYGIYMSRISGKFHITHIKEKHTFKESYPSLERAVKATKKLVKEHFKPTSMIYKGHGFNREIVKLVTVRDYKKDRSIYDKLEVFVKDSEGAMYGKWHGLRFLYEATTENLRTMETIHMLEEQIENTRKMIGEAKKNMKPSLTVERFLELVTMIKEEKE